MHGYDVQIFVIADIRLPVFCKDMSAKERVNEMERKREENSVIAFKNAYSAHFLCHSK